MKILIVSLARVGDFLQLTPVIEGLRVKHAGAQVDVLVFKGTERVRDLIPFVGRWWTLDRDALQAGLGRADIPLTTSMDVLGERLNEIAASGYDLVINLTHTQFSGYVAGLISAPARVGLSRDAAGVAHFNSPWFAYLDQHAQRPGADVFHHLDVFWRACDLGALIKTWSYRRPGAARAEVDRLNLGAGPLVACQPFTSSVDKDWGVDQWVEALNTLKHARPDLSFALLGAPDEAARVARVVARVPGAVAAITTFAGALEVIDRAAVFLTGDTSVKHLAAASDTPVIELCLGPSEYRRTGAYRAKSVILTAAPDGAIEVPLVVAITGRVLDGRINDLADVALAARARVLRPKRLAGEFWVAVDAAAPVSRAAVESWLDRLTWHAWLSDRGAPAVSAADFDDLLGPDQRPPLITSLIANLDFLERNTGPAGDAGEESSTRRQIRVKLIQSLKHTLMETQK